jgi:hypothetical protein
MPGLGWRPMDNYTRIVYPDLSGTWYMGGPINTGLPCLILQQNKMLFFINEMGGTSVGEFVDAGTVVAPAWGGLIGKITNDVKRINWANKSWWVRQKP